MSGLNPMSVSLISMFEFSYMQSCSQQLSSLVGSCLFFVFAFVFAVFLAVIDYLDSLLVLPGPILGVLMRWLS